MVSLATPVAPGFSWTARPSLRTASISPGIHSPGEELFGSYSYMATVFAVLPEADALAEALRGDPGTLASASALSDGLCAARVLAGGAPALYRALNLCRSAARRHLSLPEGRGIW